MLLLLLFRDDDIKVDGLSSSVATADVVADSSVIVPSFDIDDDTPVTFRTRPTRTKLVSTMLRQRSVSQHIANARVPIHTTPTASRHASAAILEPSVSEKLVTASSAHQSSPVAPRLPDQSFADTKTSEETTALLSSPHLEKPVISRRNRSGVTRTDAVESPSPSLVGKLPVKAEDLLPVKIEPQTTTPLPTAVPHLVKNSTEAALPQLSPVKVVSTAASLDSSVKFTERKMPETVTSQISPIARKNQTLLEHLKRPPSFPGVPSDTVDVKKLRTSPPHESKSPTVTGPLRSSTAESKTAPSFDKSSASSSLAVTLNPPSRQPLSVKTDASNTSSSRFTNVGSDRATSVKSSVISPRFVSYSFAACLLRLSSIMLYGTLVVTFFRHVTAPNKL